MQRKDGKIAYGLVFFEKILFSYFFGDHSEKKLLHMYFLQGVAYWVLGPILVHQTTKFELSG